MAEMTLPTLREGWIWASLSELCERVSVGHVGPTTEYFCSKETGVPFVRSQDVRPGKLHLGEVAHVRQEFHNKLKKSKLRAGDILIVRVGANRGDSCVVPKDVGEVNCANIVFARPIFPNGFLGFYFRSPFGQQMLLSLTTGAAQGVLNTQDIARLPVPCPPLITQERVASILSAYDDLIENNTRRIQILEDMGRRLYEEWFVRFRFPGHENVKMVESQLGLIPEGWEISTVAETFDVLGGGTPSTSVEEYWHDGSINWYAPTDLTRSGQVFIDESGDKITQLGLAKSSARMFPPFSVMMTSRATLGVIAINTTEACTNQGFINCIPSERLPLYVQFHWLKQNVGLFISLATGATFKEITKGNFKQIKLILPAAILINRFQNLVEPMMQQLLNLQRKNSNLRRTRDLLLPKLISGEIDVSNFPEPE